MKALKLLTLVAILAIQACATNLNTPLAAEKRQSIKSIAIHGAIPQDEVRAAVKVANSSAVGMQGGLIGLAISANIDAKANKKRTANANALIEPLWNDLLDYDFRAKADQLLINGLKSDFTVTESSSTSPLVLAKLEIVNEINQLEANQALMYVLLSYGFIDDSKRLRTAMDIHMFEKPLTPLTTKPSKPIYKNSFVYESQFVGEGGESSLSLWGADNATLLKTTLENSVSVVKDLFLYDVNLGTAADNCATKATISVENFLTFKPQNLSGIVIPIEMDQVVVRPKSGWIYAVEPNETNTAAQTAATQCKATIAGV